MPSVIRCGEDAEALTRRPPLGQVPVLEAWRFRLWETLAIFDGPEAVAPEPRMISEAPEGLARMRQAFFNGVFAALEKIPSEGWELRVGAWGLARCHLWPMLAYFGMVPDGEERIAARHALAAWYGWMETCPAAPATRPELTKEAMA